MVKLCFIILALSFSVITTLYYVKTENSSTQFQFDYQNLSPKEVVGTYWQASVNGNEEIVAQMITKVPKSFAQVCKGERKNISLLNIMWFNFSRRKTHARISE